MSAIHVMVQVREYREILAVTIDWLERLTRSVMLAGSFREKAPRPKAKVIAYANQFSRVSRLRRCSKSRFETFESRQCERDSQSF